MDTKTLRNLQTVFDATTSFNFNSKFGDFFKF